MCCRMSQSVLPVLLLVAVVTLSHLASCDTLPSSPSFVLLKSPSLPSSQYALTSKLHIQSITHNPVAVYVGHHKRILCRVSTASQGGSRVHSESQVQTYESACTHAPMCMYTHCGDCSVEIYGRMSTDLLPTPAKSHYIFNLRDLSKCIQGQ